MPSCSKGQQSQQGQGTDLLLARGKAAAVHPVRQQLLGTSKIQLRGEGEAVAVQVWRKDGRCLGSSRGREKGLEMGDGILSISVYMEYFAGESGLCVVTAANVKVS